jgi:secreted trypsin-like serine protease
MTGTTKDLRGKWVQTGIVSYTNICGDGSLFTRASNYYSWMKSQMLLNVIG